MGLLDDKRGLYEAFWAKDARFDGRFYVGISSTGIYCRPVCRAKRPKAENCTFFVSAAEAEHAGYRPCLLCRPELAPGASMAGAETGIALQAARMIEENCVSGESLEAIAARLGCTDRHLRRVFAAQYHVSPVQYAQTCRLLLAKTLLTDTGLSVLDVAMAAGFGSLRRLNALFRSRYGLPPTALRKHAAEDKARGGITLTLAYRPPYRWDEMLSFLQGRAIPGVEAVRNGEYLRTARIAAGEGYVCGWMKVGNRPEKNALAVTVSESLLPILPGVLARVRRLFDLYCAPDAVYEGLSGMDGIRPGLRAPGTRLPGCFDAFEMAARAVLGQQITVKAARTLAARIVAAYGLPIETGIDGLTHAFPSPRDILALEGPVENHFGPLGVTSARSRTICELARELEEGKLRFEHCADPETEMEKLTAIRGIGRWTAQYIAMRAMSWTDAFLETDAGIKKALAPMRAREMIQASQEWRPWRSYATICLWNSLQ